MILGLGELRREGAVGLGDAFLMIVDKRLTEGEEEPVAVSDEDVVEEFAEFRIFGGGRAQVDGAEEVGISPPLVADQLIDQGKHGRNLAGSRRDAEKRNR